MLSISTKNINNIKFKAVPNKNNIEKGSESQAEQKSLNIKTKIMVGATAAAAIAIAGLAISNGVKKGRLLKEETLKKELEDKRIAEQVKEYFEQKTKEAEELKQKITESDIRNEEWLQAQHSEKEKEYSDWWNKALKEKEEYEARNNDITFEEPLNEEALKKDVDLGHIIGKPKTSDAAKTALEECESLTFDSPNLVLMRDKYDGSMTYDLGLRYAIVAHNTAMAKGTGAIINEVPKIFEGINEKELISALDELPSRLEYDKFNNFEIAGKKFTARGIGGGAISRVYIITDEAGNNICFKHVSDPYLMIAGHGIYNEVGILQEANKAGVCDVPKLFMANPIGCCVQKPNSEKTATKGAWQLVEYIGDIKPIYSDSLRFSEWLGSKGLKYTDDKKGNYVGEVLVDLGGVIDLAHTVDDIRSTSSNILWLFKAYHNGKTSTEILDAINKYSK